MKVGSGRWVFRGIEIEEHTMLHGYDDLTEFIVHDGDDTAICPTMRDALETIAGL